MKFFKKNMGISCFCLIILSACIGNYYLNGADQDFFQAVRKGDLHQVKAMLKENSCLVHRQDQWGRTSIYHAIIKKNQTMVKLLIQNGALLRVGDLNLRAPIHYAGFMNDIAMVKLLLENGAVIDTRAIGAATPLIHSSLSNRFDLSQFLVNHGADINIQCNSLTTPLYFAVFNNNMKLLKFLLAQGADIDTPDYLNRTPFFIAVRDGYSEMVKALINHGADYQFKDKFWQRSMLHLAAIGGHRTIVEILLDKGLNINIEDGKTYTPTDCAHRYGHATLARILKKRGGRANTIKKVILKDTLVKENVSLGQARIIKLQNGSWGIMTRNRLMVFAYSEIGRSPSEKSLLNGYITIAEMKNKNVFYLDIDFHPSRGTYSLQGRNPVYGMQEQLNNLTFILNPSYKESYLRLKLKNSHFPKSKQVMEIEGIKLTAVPSYLNDIGYFIECDGLNIFWLSGVSDAYISTKKDLRGVEYVAKNLPRIDILILGTPGGIGPERGNKIRLAYMEMQTLNPRKVIFMGKPSLERRILHQVKRRIQNPKNIYCSENPGDSFLYVKK